MSNKRLDRLMTIARRASENEDFSDDTGISEEELVQYVNDAQLRLLSLICAKHPTVFVKEVLIDVVSGQESYSLPNDIFLENRITSVEYADTGDIRDLNHLRPASIKSRENSFTGYPSEYIRRSGAVLLQPVPSQGGIIRVNYQRRIAELDIRRGRISAVTLDSATNTITSLTIDVTQNDFDGDMLNEVDHICVVGVLGDQQMPNIQIDSVDTTSGLASVDSSFTYINGDSITVGDYVTTGFNSSSHSELPKVCERYLVAYMAWKLLKRDSSEDSFEQLNELKSMEKDIVASFSDITDDIQLIPMISMDD